MDCRKADAIRRCKAVLFDYDGVIVRSMEDNYSAWKYALGKRGVNIIKKDYFLMEGSGTSRVANYFLKKYGKTNNGIAAIVKDKEKYFIENSKTIFYPGIKKIILSLKNSGYLLGLVTGGNRNRLLRTVGRGFFNSFDVVITGDMVKETKPEPEPYLVAAKKLKLKPGQCVAVENAPLGIESAKAANMYCVGVCSTLEKKYLNGADCIVTRISQIKDIFLKNKKE